MLKKAFITTLGYIDKTTDLLGKIGGYTTLALIIALMFYEVILRYCFNSPTSFSLEFSIFCQVLIVATASPYILREGGHVSIGFVTEKLSETAKNWFHCITSIIGFCYCVILTIMTWATAAWSLKVGVYSDTVGVPLAPFQFSLCLGLALLGLQFIARSYRYYKLTDIGPETNASPRHHDI